jgi:hypothetical protein
MSGWFVENLNLQAMILRHTVDKDKLLPDR